MTTGISPIGADAFSKVAAVRSAAGGEVSSGSPVDALGKSFSDMLNSLTQAEQGTDAMVSRLAVGENVDLHDLMIGMEQTDIQFRVAMAIRDKLVDAYREVMRMQV
jgi:flagellar hook-basal body complex protein FliE